VLRDNNVIVAGSEGVHGSNYFSLAYAGAQDRQQR
jgi:hypothetical protein